MPHWQEWGAKASAALNEVLAERPRAMELAKILGTDMTPEEAKKAQEDLRQLGAAAAEKLVKRMKWPNGYLVEGPTGWRWKIIEAITREAKDMDVDIAQWFKGDTPLGISKPLIPRGIFPPAEATKAQLESAEYLAMRAGRYEVGKNYTSFHENETESPKVDRSQTLTASGYLARGHTQMARSQSH